MEVIWGYISLWIIYKKFYTITHTFLRTPNWRVLGRNMATRNELENAELVNFNLWCEDKEFDSYIDSLSILLSKKSSNLSHLKITTIRKHLKVIILNLWCVWLKDREKYLIFSRYKNTYSKKILPQRYNQIGISYKFVEVVDALIENRFIKFISGIYFPNYKKKSRMRATPKLTNQIIRKLKISKSVIQVARNTECIILRDKDESNENKIEVDYKDTKHIKEMRNNLIEYNNLIRRTHIDIPTFPVGGVKKSNNDSIKIDFESDVSKFSRRIFSNNSWKDGGRFYGGWWLQVPSAWRKDIRINNQPTTEIDYSCLHISFLYAKNKINYFRQVNKDAYDLSGYGYEMDEGMREFLKIILLTSINCKKGKNKDISIAKKSIQYHVNKNKNEYDWVKKRNIDIEQLIIDFTDYHKPIRKYFFSGVGLSLQYIDALIAEKVLNHFTKLEIPVLCIHDSFIIQTKYSIGDGDKSLHWIMGSIFQEVLKSKIKNYSYPKMKYDDGMLTMKEIENLMFKQFTKEYWNRVDTHKKRKYVINWYNQDTVHYS